MLVEPLLPPFLKPIQFVDFQDAGEDHYRQVLRKLLAGLLLTPARRIGFAED